MSKTLNKACPIQFPQRAGEMPRMRRRGGRPIRSNIATFPGEKIVPEGVFFSHPVIYFQIRVPCHFSSAYSAWPDKFKWKLF